MAKEKIAAASDGDTDEIIYVPGNHDPVNTSVGGIDFRANVPVTVKRSHTVWQLHRKEVQTNDGPRTQGQEVRVPLAEVLRHNPSFIINGVQPERKATALARVPTSPDQYRGYAIAWISQSIDAATITTRWKSEQVLRDRCGVAQQEIDYIVPFLDAKLIELGGARIIDAETGKAA